MHKTFSPLHNEIEPRLQAIEVTSTFQIPSFQIVGLPSQEIAEARERVRAAMMASGFDFPKRRIVINLSPAWVRKSGTGLDLPIALAILRESQRQAAGPRTVAAGELGLHGEIKPVGQALRALYAAWRTGADLLLLPTEDAELAAENVEWIRRAAGFETPSPPVIGVSTLADAFRAIETFPDLPPNPPARPKTLEDAPAPELLRVSPVLERILMTSAVGAHHLLLLGPRGVGKSHALEWLQAVFPKTIPDTLLRQVLLRELQGLHQSSDAPVPASTPVRRLGSYVRPAALIGSARADRLKPGEFSLAHGGLLVADELPEWPRDSREALRQPLEEGRVTLTRSDRSVQFPTDFTLAATGNQCPCGAYPVNVSGAICRCTPHERTSYLNRLSRPVLDRIDMVFHALKPPDRKAVVPSHDVQNLRERVALFREEAVRRYGRPPGKLTGTEVERVFSGGDPAENSAQARILRLLDDLPVATSLRSRHKILRIALTLATLDGAAFPEPVHLSEAMTYRFENTAGDE